MLLLLAAIMLSPVTAARQPIDAAGCEVHVVSDRGRGTESRMPCGEWFVPGPPGSYLLWLEQGKTISAAPALLRYGETGPDARAAGEHVMVPAGRVALAAPPGVAGADSLRLIVLERSGELSAFERKVPLDVPKDGVLMPEGPLLSGLYDKDGNVLALAPPVRVVAGEVARVAPKPPPRGSGAVMLVLRGKAAAVRLGSLPPDVLHRSRERLIAIWSSVPVGPAELRLDGGEPMAVTVSEGAVTTIRRSLN